MKSNNPETKQIVKLSATFFIIAAVFTLFISFYVAFSLKSFSRVLITAKAGLFTGFSISFISAVLFLSARKIPGFMKKEPPIHTIIFTIATLISGVLAEKFIFLMGGVHYYWVLGVTLAAFFIGILFDAHHKIKQMVDSSIAKLEKLYSQLILSLNKSLEAVEPYNTGHGERVAWYSQKIAQKMGMDEQRIQNLVLGGLLHDLGKIGVSEKILLKSSPLDEKDWEIIRQHPDIAEKILKPLRSFNRVIRFIRYHHERTDGKGYKKLRSEEIPLESRIIGVAEAFDAMTTDKSFAPTYTPLEAVRELEKNSKTQFDPEVVKNFSEFIIKEKDFTCPDHQEIRKLLGLEGVDVEKLDARSIENILKTAKRLSLLERFYKLMGSPEKKKESHLWVSLGAGLILGAVLGFSVFAITDEPIHLLSFLLQGLTAGSVVFLIYPNFLDFTLKRTDINFWKKPLGKSIIAFPAGLCGGAAALFLVYYNITPGVRLELTGWDVAYPGVTGLLASSVSYFSDLFRKSSALLIVNLKNLKKIYFDLVYSLAFALEAKDPYTRGHTERVARYSLLIGEKMNLSSEEMEDLKMAAIFHDIGKIGVKLAILNKKSKLDKHEFLDIKKHPEISESIIRTIDLFSHIGPLVRHHHEHYNGGGYPDGLKGNEIPLISRIISVADAYDALVTERPYKKGMPREKALSILKKESKVKFDPCIVEVFQEEVQKIETQRLEKIQIYPGFDEESLTREK